MVGSWLAAMGAALSGHASWRSMSLLGSLPASFSYGGCTRAADPHDLVVMRCLNPAPLHRQLGLAALLACRKPSQNIAYMQGLGRVADIIRVGVMLQRGLVCIIETSFQKASSKRCLACRRCWVLALQNAVNTVKNCYLLRLARVLRGPCFFRFGFRAFWRAPNTEIGEVSGTLKRSTIPIPNAEIREVSESLKVATNYMVS